MGYLGLSRCSYCNSFYLLNELFRPKGTDPKGAGHGAYTVTTDQKKNREKETGPSPGGPEEGSLPSGKSTKNQGPGVLSVEFLVLTCGSRGTICSYKDEHLRQIFINQAILQSYRGTAVGSRVMQMTLVHDNENELYLVEMESISTW